MEVLSSEVKIVFGQYIVIREIVNMPNNIQGFISESDDGWYNIYINASLSKDKKESVFNHELKHILSNDINNDLNILAIEQ